MTHTLRQESLDHLFTMNDRDRPGRRIGHDYFGELKGEIYSNRPTIILKSIIPEMTDGDQVICILPDSLQSGDKFEVHYEMVVFAYDSLYWELKPGEKTIVKLYN